MTLEKKLIEKQKSKNNIIKDEYNQNKLIDEKKLTEEKEINQSKMDSWKEKKKNNLRYKKSKYKGNSYNNVYNNKSKKFFYKNSKYFKDYKSYKSAYNQQLISNNHKKNYIEKEIELNSKGETEGDSEIKISEQTEESLREVSLVSNHKNNINLDSQENSEELNSLEYLKIDLMKSQSEDLSYKNLFDFKNIGIKLFPGAFQYEKKRSYRQNDANVNSNINRKYLEEDKNIKLSDYNLDKVRDKNDIECNNYLCKSNCNNIKIEQKKGLALALDYYSSFLEDKIK